MTSARRALLLVLAIASVAVVALASVGTAVGASQAVAPGASPDYRVIPDPDGDDAEQPPFAQRTRSEVEAFAVRQPQLARAIDLRPGSGLRIRFLADERIWRVSLRAETTPTTLARVDIDDRTLEVVDTFELPVGTYPPRHSERDAIDAVVDDPRVRREARAWGGIGELRAKGTYERSCCWEVDLFDPGRTDGDPNRPVVRADVVDATLDVTGVWTGIQVSWTMARGDRDGFGGDVNEPVVWIALFVLFALVALDWSRLRSLPNADVLAVLLLGVSHEAFQRGAIDWSVPLAMPPLIWLAARMGWLFARGVPVASPARAPRSGAARLALRRVPTMALVVLCVALAGVRIGLTLDGGNVIDVGYASVAGARLELRGEAPWANMPDDVERGDTYGPLAYLAYVPATALVDDPDVELFGTQIRAAQWTAIAADLGCALLLALIGWRWLSRRAGALLAAAWLACPWTAWALASGSNDALPALGLLAAFCAIRVPVVRGALVGAATMTKFAPALALAPMLHVGARRRLRQSLWTIVGFAVVIALSLAWVAWRLDGSLVDDLRLFWQRTLGFQGDRISPFSIWGLYEWDEARTVALIVLALVALLACMRPRARDAWQVAAGTAALVVGAQLVTTHWFYLYIPWFLPFVLIACVAQRERLVPSPGSRPANAPTGARDHDRPTN